MTTIKVVGREFFGTVNNGHVYMTKQFRELLGLENGDVLLLEIKDFKPSAKNDHLTYLQKAKLNGRESHDTSNYTNDIEHASLTDAVGKDSENEQATNPVNSPSAKKIEVDVLKNILQTPRSLQEIADILRIEPYDALVELDQLVKAGDVLRDDKKYLYKGVSA